MTLVVIDEQLLFYKACHSGKFFWMHYPGCDSQNLTRLGVSSILSLHFVPISWQSPSLVTVLETDKHDLSVLTASQSDFNVGLKPRGKVTCNDNENPSRTFGPSMFWQNHITGQDPAEMKPLVTLLTML